MASTTQPFRILTFDGGGMRGVVSARLLIEVERQVQARYGRSLREHFDLIAGTSTGAMLAAGIAVGYTADELLRVYLERGAEIFPYRSLLAPARWRLLRKYGPSAPKFSNEGLIRVISGLQRFRDRDGDLRLKDVGQRDADGTPHPLLLILGFDTQYRNTTWFVNHHAGSSHRWFDDQPLWKVCVASASAPTYFPACGLNYREPSGEVWSFPHVDGGVTANNPALCAIAYAIGLGRPLEALRLLSIGTGLTKTPLEFQTVEGWGLVDWGLRIADVFMEGQAEAQGNVCLSLLGGATSNRYLRLQFELNQVFGTPRDPLAPAPVLPDRQRVNAWTGTHVPEAMDDARAESIGKLLDAAQAYLDKGHIMETRFEHYGRVRQAIADFVAEELHERSRVPK